MDGDCDSAVAKFSEIIKSAISRYVPVRHRRAGSFPSWFTPELRAAIRSKKASHALWKRDSDLAQYIEFKRLRAVCVRLSRLCSRAEQDRIEAAIGADQAVFWRHFKRVCGGSSHLPHKMSNGTVEVEGGDAVVNLLASHYFSVYSKDLLPDIPALDTPVLTASMSVTLEEVHTALNKLGSETTSGPDGIPPIFLSKCKDQLAPVLHYLFNLSLSTGKFPTLWKFSYIFPIFKSGDPSLTANYRPVAILSEPSKVFESIVTKKLYSIVGPLISQDQHGFIGGRSITSNLLLFNDFLKENIPKNIQVD